MSISVALINDFKSEISNTAKVLAAVPEDKLDWKPHEKSMTLGRLASHIAENPSWVGAMTPDEFDMAEFEKNYTPFVASSTDGLVAEFEKNAGLVEQTLDGQDDDHMNATWTMSSGGHVMMSMPRAVAVRSMIIHHMIHHRGQLTVYLRLLDAAVPATYGPTADDKA